MAGSREFIEPHTIGQIPEDERHGRARDLFTVWFGANIILLTMITGGLATTVFGLPLGWALVAILVGELTGAIFMALHAAQGPQLGVPQMMQSRGQFGSQGAAAIIAIVVVMYVAFFATNLGAAGEALHGVAPTMPLGTAIVLLTLTNFLVAVVGYRMVHLVMKIGTVVLGVEFLLALGAVVVSGHLSAADLDSGQFSVAGFLGVVAINALWQVAYAPYVSDYSRYMPKDSGVRPAFWATYAGCVLGTLVPMSLGAVVGTAIQGEDVLGGLLSMIGPLGAVLLWSAALYAAVGNAMNLYGATLCTITVGQTFRPSWVPKAGGRTAVAVVLAGLSLLIALAGSQNFLDFLSTVLTLLFFVLTPWTAVNLVDYYLVRHGDYDVASFFRPDGGIYGRWSTPAMGCFVLGLAVQVPFLSTDLYTGPLAQLMGGVDVAWFVGLAVTCPVYYLTARRRPTEQPELRVQEDVI